MPSSIKTILVDPIIGYSIVMDNVLDLTTDFSLAKLETALTSITADTVLLLPIRLDVVKLCISAKISVQVLTVSDNLLDALQRLTSGLPVLTDGLTPARINMLQDAWLVRGITHISTLSEDYLRQAVHWSDTFSNSFTTDDVPFILETLSTLRADITTETLTYINFLMKLSINSHYNQMVNIQNALDAVDFDYVDNDSHANIIKKIRMRLSNISESNTALLSIVASVRKLEGKLE